MKRVKRPVLSPKMLKSAKVRITTYLDREILEFLRKKALQTGGKYQTVLNQILRVFLKGKEENLEKRVARLEKIVFKKHAA